MIQYPTILTERADRNLQKVGADEGDLTEVGNLRLTSGVDRSEQNRARQFET
jgi:hypothetical protein